MSPRIEEAKTIEQEGHTLVYFTLDLNDPAEFDSEEFDRLAFQMHAYDSEEVSFMKFIVIEGRMYIFQSELSRKQKLFHDKTLQLLNDSGIDGKVQCAGRIDVQFVKKYGQSDNRRTISDYSDSLRAKDKLSKYDSNSYKTEIIGSLGLPFTIE